MDPSLGHRDTFGAVDHSVGPSAFAEIIFLSGVLLYKITLNRTRTHFGHSAVKMDDLVQELPVIYLLVVTSGYF